MTTTPPVELKPEEGWLIEHETETKWWTGWPGPQYDDEFWTKDSLKALRFSRRQDAEAMAFWHFDGRCRITEHEWSMGATRPVPVPAPEVARLVNGLRKDGHWFADEPDQVMLGASFVKHLGKRLLQAADTLSALSTRITELETQQQPDPK